MAVTRETMDETQRICEMVVRHFLQKMPLERLREFFVKSVISESCLVEPKYRLENLVAQTRARLVTTSAIQLIGAKDKPVQPSACGSSVRASSSRHCGTHVAPALRTLPRSGRVCGLSYSRSYLLSRHHRQKHPELKRRRPLKKAAGGLKSASINLRKHKQGEKPPQAISQVCGASYARHDGLKCHFLRRHPEHEFICPLTPASWEIGEEEKLSQTRLRESNLVKLKLHLAMLAAQTPIPNIDAIPLDSSLTSPTAAKFELPTSLGSPVNKGMPPTVPKSGSKKWNYDFRKRDTCVLCGRRIKDAEKLRQHQAAHGTAAEKRFVLETVATSQITELLFANS